MNPWVVLIAVGLVAGLISGYLGVGAAIVVIPVLTLILGYEQKTAQSVSLAIMVAMALTGALMYRYKMGVAPAIGPVAAMGVAGVVGSLLGATLADISRPQQLKAAFAVFVITVGVVMLVRAVREAWAT